MAKNELVGIMNNECKVVEFNLPIMKEIARIDSEMKQGVTDIMENALVNMAVKCVTLDAQLKAEDSKSKGASTFLMEALGYAKSMAYSIVAVGKMVQDDNETGIRPCFKDYSFTQLRKMMEKGKGTESVVACIETGKINSEMTSREIADEVANWCIKPIVENITGADGNEYAVSKRVLCPVMESAEDEKKTANEKKKIEDIHMTFECGDSDDVTIGFNSLGEMLATMKEFMSTGYADGYEHEFTFRIKFDKNEKKIEKNGKATK